jgi:hypothetical protein
VPCLLREIYATISLPRRYSKHHWALRSHGDLEVGIVVAAHAYHLPALVFVARRAISYSGTVESLSLDKIAQCDSCLIAAARALQAFARPTKHPAHGSLYRAFAGPAAEDPTIDVSGSAPLLVGEVRPVPPRCLTVRRQRPTGPWYGRTGRRSWSRSASIALKNLLTAKGGEKNKAAYRLGVRSNDDDPPPRAHARRQRQTDGCETGAAPRR